jgi:hypothetical protein
MTDTTATTQTATPDLRGLVLVAHYAFRKEVGSRGGHEKGMSSLAAAKHRETNNPEALHEMLYHTTALSEVNKSMQFFGSPAEVPAEGLTAFLQQKLDTLQQAYNLAFQEMGEAAKRVGRTDAGFEPAKEALRELAHRQGTVEARLFMLYTFTRIFSPVLRQLAGA